MGLAIGFTHRFWPGPIAPEVKRLQFKIYLWGFLAFQQQQFSSLLVEALIFGMKETVYSPWFCE